MADEKGKLVIAAIINFIIGHYFMAIDCRPNHHHGHTSGSHHQHKVSGPHYGRGAGPHVNEYVLQEKSDRMRKEEQHKVSLVYHFAIHFILLFLIGIPSAADTGKAASKRGREVA